MFKCNNQEAMLYDWINYFYDVGSADPQSNRWIYLYLSITDTEYDGFL